MKILKYILFLFLIITIGISMYITVQPNGFEVSKTRTIKAPASVLYNNVIDFKNWESWSSRVASDPNIKITLSNKTKGVNGTYSWEDEDGIRVLKTTEIVANASIKQQMQFLDFPAFDVDWEFKPNEDGTTNVTRAISGKDLPFKFKAFSALIGGVEEEIGLHYERSLEKLESIVITDMKKYTITVNGITEHGGGYYLYNTTSCKISDLEDKMEEMMARVSNYAMSNNITMAGFPYSNYHKWDEENNAVMFSCCIPTIDKVISSESDILTGQLKPFKALKTTLKGNYVNLKETWVTATKYIKENNLETLHNSPALEVYQTNPKHEPNPSNWITAIYIAVK